MGWAEASPGLVARFVSRQRQGRTPPFPELAASTSKRAERVFFQSEGARGPCKGPKALCGVGGSEFGPRRPFSVQISTGRGYRTGSGKVGFLAPLVSHSIGGGGIFHSLWKSAGCFPGFAAFFLKKGPLSPERGPFCPLRFPHDEADRTPPAIPGSKHKRKEGRHEATLLSFFTPGPGTKRPRSPPGCSCGPERTPRSSGRW